MKSLKTFHQHAEEKALAPRPLQKCEGLHLIQKEVHGLILVIAEKPSVAQSIAKVLGATSRRDGYAAHEQIKKAGMVVLPERPGTQSVQHTLPPLRPRLQAEFPGGCRYLPALSV